MLPPVTSFSNSKSFSGIRLHAQLHARILAAAAGLLLVRVLVFRRLADGFAIRHLRLADVRAHVELALHAVDDDFQVQLAHAGKNRLAGLGIGRYLEASDLPCASFWIAMPSFSWSALVFGSIAS